MRSSVLGFFAFTWKSLSLKMSMNRFVLPEKIKQLLPLRPSYLSGGAWWGSSSECFLEVFSATKLWIYEPYLYYLQAKAEIVRSMTRLMPNIIRASLRMYFSCDSSVHFVREPLGMPCTLRLGLRASLLSWKMVVFKGAHKPVGRNW